MTRFYTVPSTIEWTLTDLHQVDQRLKETTGSEYEQILRTLRILATSYPTCGADFQVQIGQVYEGLRAILSSY
jgi:hypothetical protein